VRPAYGKWSFPGGGANPGETFRACAFREFQEETGIKLNQYKPIQIGILKIWLPFFRWETYLMTIARDLKQLTPVEFSELGWVPLDQLRDYLLCFGVRSAVKKFFKIRPKNP
jgi:8-oxo-dGTP pyrophosphatase MutT (NUDIX family)